MFGGRYASLVVVPPQLAIMGVGAIRREPAALGDTIALRRRMPLSLTFDHRAVTEAEAARFLATVIRDLEEST